MPLTERARRFFVDDEYKFTFDTNSRKDETISFWRCECKNKGCNARIHVKNETVIKRFHHHNHGNNSTNSVVTEIRNTFKRRAIELIEVDFFAKSCFDQKSFKN